MYNPLELSKKIEKIVIDGVVKKYYRFRPTRFYGGIATADTVGCNLRCKFCWSSNSIWNPKNMGKFYSPKQVTDTLYNIAKKKGYTRMRVSGGEPTIGRKHLIELLKNINNEFLFILETVYLLLICLYLSFSLSKLSRQYRTIIQRIALLENKLSSITEKDDSETVR